MAYVIIGNSTACVGAIEGIRKTDKDNKIIVISNENYHTYSRPLISYYLGEKTTEEKMKYRGNDFYTQNNAELIFGNVTKIDSTAKKVVLVDGKEISYDKLLIGTGSKPFVPKIEGFETVKNSFTFMSFDDALMVKEAINPDCKVLIIGAGLIGLKAAEGLQDKVSHITVIDLADRILPSILDEKGSAIVKSHIEEYGVEFILADTVASFNENKATLKSGKMIDFDILIMAVGVRPNTEIALSAGCEVNRGIVTNLLCETTVNDIYAAGDCAESFDITTDENKVLALLPNAYMQGECAGENMANGSKEYKTAIPMNAIGFFSLHMITAGSYVGESIITEDGKNYKRLIVKDGLLKGYIMINNVARAGIYTALIKDKTPLSSLDFEALKDKPQLIAFTKQERAQKLGGAKIEN